MSTDDEVLPEGMRALLALFADELADVKFGDLDRAALERTALSVQIAFEQLAKAEAAAEVARLTAEAAGEEMLRAGQRALAYARIYAEATPALSEKVQAITLARRTRPTEAPATALVVGAPRRRGRPPKGASEATGTLALESAEDLPTPLDGRRSAGVTRTADPAV